jgi:hypothetical protein
MRRWGLLAVLLVAACVGDRKEALPESGATPDSIRGDSVPLRGDSMMARDTAQPG